jgi:C1A family cysteine protease
MQTELQNNGPYEVAFEVYSDFMNYAGGVYQHKSGFLEGGHAVLNIGWGVLDGTPYWLIQNSWGTSWGLDGFFLILRGNDECGIEDDAYAGLFV